MNLILTTPGTYISIKDSLLHIKSEKDNVNSKISPMKVERIIISTNILISSAVLKTCTEYNIDFVLLSDHEVPIGRFWHSKFGSITTIRRKQLELSETCKGFDIVKRWIIAKISYQYDFIKEIANNRTSRFQDIMNKAEQIKDNISKIENLNFENIKSLMPYEGNASRIYFEILSSCMQEKYKFKGRSRQPAKDEFNAFLNYAYGILYSDVEKACIIAGLDPYIGFLHSDNYNKKSLVFDIIENFRIDAERITFHLFTRKLVNDKMVDKIKDGYTLNKEGKKLLFDSRSQYYDKTVIFGKKKMKRKSLLQAFCHKFANELLEI